MDDPITGNLTGAHLSFSHLPLPVRVHQRCVEGETKKRGLIVEAFGTRIVTSLTLFSPSLTPPTIRTVHTVLMS